MRDAGGTCAVLHIPHSSADVPATVRPQFLLDDEDLRRELLLMADWFTDELFALPPDVATTVRFPVSRLVLDPERFLDPSEETMERVGMGAVYTKTSHGAPLRDEAVAARERADLVARYHAPHHLALERAVTAALSAHGRCLILDCHSFPSRPLPYEEAAAVHTADPGAFRHRPAVCIGTDSTRAPQSDPAVRTPTGGDPTGGTPALGGLHTPVWLRELAEGVMGEMLAAWPDGAGAGAAAAAGVAFDRPFSGAIVPSRFFGTDTRVLSLMIELRRDLYMDEETGGRLPGFAACCAAVQDALRRLIAVVMQPH